MTRTRTGLHGQGAAYARQYRALRPRVRRPDALDMERGPMPDEDAAPDLVADGWLLATVIAGRVRALSRPDSKGRDRLAADAWAIPKLTHRVARETLGLSRERVRQLQRQALYVICDHVDGSLTDIDRDVLDAGQDPSAGWSCHPMWGRRMDWLGRLSAAVWEWRRDTAELASTNRAHSA